MKHLIFLSTLLLGAESSVNAQPAPFSDAKLIWTLPWDADWVTAVSFIGNNKVAAGNKQGDILVWDLPAVAWRQGPAARPPACWATPMKSRAC